MMSIVHLTKNWLIILFFCVHLTMFGVYSHFAHEVLSVYSPIPRTIQNDELKTAKMTTDKP